MPLTKAKNAPTYSARLYIDEQNLKKAIELHNSFQDMKDKDKKERYSQSQVQMKIQSLFP